MLRSPLRFYRTECIRQLVASERHQFAGEVTLVWRLDRPAIDSQAEVYALLRRLQAAATELSKNFRVDLTSED
jgi:hypothetical protein